MMLIVSRFVSVGQHRAMKIDVNYAARGNYWYGESSKVQTAYFQIKELCVGIGTRRRRMYWSRYETSFLMNLYLPSTRERHDVQIGHFTIRLLCIYILLGQFGYILSGSRINNKIRNMSSGSSYSEETTIQSSSLRVCGRSYQFIWE